MKYRELNLTVTVTCIFLDLIRKREMEVIKEVKDYFGFEYEDFLPLPLLLFILWAVFREYFILRLIFSIALTISSCLVYKTIENKKNISWEINELIDIIIFATSAAAAVSYFNQIAITALLFFNITGSFLDGFLNQFLKNHDLQRYLPISKTIVNNFCGTFLGVYSSFVGIIIGATEYLVDQKGSLFQGIIYFLLTFLLSILSMEGGIRLSKSLSKTSELSYGKDNFSFYFTRIVNNLRYICIGLSIFTFTFNFEYQLVLSYLLSTFGCLFGSEIFRFFSEVMIENFNSDQIEIVSGFLCNLIASLIALIVLFQCEFIPSVCKYDELLVLEFTESFLGSVSSFISSTQVFHLLFKRLFNKNNKPLDRYLIDTYQYRVGAEITLLCFSLGIFHLLT